MSNYLALASDILILILNFTLYFKIIPLKRDNWLDKTLLFISCAIMVSVYIVGILVFNKSTFLWMALSIYVPSFALFLCFTKYRDMRFIMTFFFLNCISLIIGFVSRYTEFVLKYSNSPIPLAISIFIFLAIIIFGRKYLKSYKELIEKVRNNWTECAIASLLIYMLLVFSSSYPKPIMERPEYGISYILLCATVCSFYGIFVKSMIKNGEIEEINKKLKKQNELYKLAYSDSLTDIGNRTSFDITIKNINKHPEIYDTVGLVVLDVNDLKLINDKYGHFSGDRCLVCVADAIKSTFNYNEYKYFRIGGDEFCILCFNKNREHIEKLLASLNKIVSNTKPYTELSIAAGYDFWHKDSSKTISQIFQTADENMYKNKERIKSSIGFINA